MDFLKLPFSLLWESLVVFLSIFMTANLYFCSVQVKSLAGSSSLGTSINEMLVLEF